MRSIAQRFEKLPRLRLLAVLLTVFALVHAVYYAMGVRFDIGQMGWQWQILDVDLLRHHLLQSLLYQHSQPPTFNLALGLVLKIAPHDYALVLQAIFLLCGFALYAGMVRLMARLGVARWLAVILSTIFMASPAFILYEHYLYYTFPLAAVLTLSAVVFDVWLEQRRAGQLALFFTLLLLQCTLWGLFHLLYFMAIASALLVLAKAQRRQILLACAVPFLLLFAVYAKNYLLFGQFGASSWLGMNLARTTVVWLPIPERGMLLETGRLSHASLNNPFDKLANCEIGETAPAPYRSIPALAQVVKSTGDINYNHYNYLLLSRDYLHDSLYVILHKPTTYILHGTLPAWLIYFTPASNYEPLHNRARMLPVVAFYDTALSGELSFPRLGDYTPYIFLLIGLPVLFFYGAYVGMGKSAMGETLSPNQKRLLLYLCFNILYVALVGNTFERGENNRFRFITDPFTLVLLGLLISQAWGYRLRERAKKAAKTGDEVPAAP